MVQRAVKVVVILALLMAVLAGAAQASVQVIGTADINGTGAGYNLIYDTGGDGLSPFVWLDYSHAGDTWANQGAWATSLNNVSGLGSVTYHLNSGISMNWGGSSWRLPSTVDNDSSYTPAAGSSEMAHLYYTDLGLTGTAVSAGNQGPFTNILPGWYWSGTQYAAYTPDAWDFNTSGGSQSTNTKTSYSYYGLAVRPAQLVPEPSTYFLLCIGLGAVGYARRKLKNGQLRMEN